MKVPCHNCESRTLKCHATCDKYKEFRAWVAQGRDNSKADRNFYQYLLDKKNERLKAGHKDRRKK